MTDLWLMYSGDKIDNRAAAAHLGERFLTIRQITGDNSKEDLADKIMKPLI